MSFEKVKESLALCDECGRGGLPVDHAWIAVDLDNTLIKSGTYPGYGSALPGAIKGIEELRDMGFKIMIWTNRTGLTGVDGKYQNITQVVKDIEAHLKTEGIPFDYVIPAMHKPSFIYKMIDDRAIQFQGDWQSVTAQIKRDLTTRNIPWYGPKEPHVMDLVF